eukprot:307032-Prorocentrum_minimum.AAC.1
MRGLRVYAVVSTYNRSYRNRLDFDCTVTCLYTCMCKHANFVVRIVFQPPTRKTFCNPWSLHGGCPLRRYARGDFRAASVAYMKRFNGIPHSPFQVRVEPHSSPLLLQQ